MADVLRLRNDSLFTTEIDSETVILDATSSRYLTTNLLGTEILRLLKQGATRESIYSHLESMIDDVEADILRRDCDAFLADLLREGLLE